MGRFSNQCRGDHVQIWKKAGEPAGRRRGFIWAALVVGECRGIDDGHKEPTRATKTAGNCSADFDGVAGEQPMSRRRGDGYHIAAAGNA